MIAEVYQEEGDKEFTRKEVCNAIYFYTEGIHVNCKDFQLNAKLYSNRATAYYHLGKILILSFSNLSNNQKKLLLSLRSAFQDYNRNYHLNRLYWETNFPGKTISP